VKVRYDEGIANRIVPEPCIVGREASGEASAGDGTGQPLSRDRNILGADAVEIAEGNMKEKIKSNRREECVPMPGKMAQSAPRPPFLLA
jgi:hypothetical protein